MINGLEVSVPLSSLTNIEENLRIKTAAVDLRSVQRSVQLPFADHHTATYVRMLPAKTPTSLMVSNSEATLKADCDRMG